MKTILGSTVLAAASLSALIASAQPPAMTPSGFTVHNTPPAGVEDVYEYGVANFGFVPNLQKVMAGSPALLRSYVDTQKRIKESARLSPAEVNVVQMAIAVENECEYCTAGHTMAGKEFFKTPAEHMEAVRTRAGMSDPKLNALRAFAIQTYASRGEVSPTDLKAFLDAGYTREHALDVVACIGAKVMSNYTNSLAKTPLDAPLVPLAEGLPFAGK